MVPVWTVQWDLGAPCRQNGRIFVLDSCISMMNKQLCSVLLYADETWPGSYHTAMDWAE